VRNLEPLSTEFKSTALSTTIADWRAAHPSADAGARPNSASLDEPLQAHNQAICLPDRKVDWLRQAAIEGERAKAAKDIDLAEERHRALAREIWVLKS
jgi:hypothetical protein